MSNEVIVTTDPLNKCTTGLGVQLGYQSASLACMKPVSPAL